MFYIKLVYIKAVTKGCVTGSIDNFSDTEDCWHYGAGILVFSLPTRRYLSSNVFTKHVKNVCIYK